MILAAGLTPAWQQIMRFDRFDVGEVNRASEIHWCASGKVLNVAVALAHLGSSVQTLALVGGPAQEAVEREFALLCIPRCWVRTTRPTRVCTTILDTGRGQTTELVENAGAVSESELGEFRDAYAREALAASVVVLTGSLPEGVPSTFYRDLLAETRTPAILDIRGPELWHALEQGPLVVKPNREELSRTVGKPLDNDHDLHAAMRELLAHGAGWVVVTQGKGPVWLAGDGALYRFQTPTVPVVNPIGSGDCLAAGMAWGLQQGRPLVDCVRLGIAAAAENVGQLLPGRIAPARVLSQADYVVVDRVA